MISYQDFQKIELRVAKVEAVERVAGADKLLKLSISLGEQQRTIVAGIALAYAPEDLVGKFIVIVANLEPATIRGVRSEGMLLAAWTEGEDKSISVVTVDREIAPGAPIK